MEPIITAIPPLFAHQQSDIEACLARPIVYNASDPGTGKTRTCIEVVRRLRLPTLVVAPKSILQAAWEADIRRFAPELTTSVAYAENRASAFRAEADVYITNTDATTWMASNPAAMAKFQDGMLIVDEITCFKHHTSARAKALRKIAKSFARKIGLSGTPTPNGIMDLWGQMLALDNGERLGGNFWGFRNTACSPVYTNRGMIRWEDKPGVADAVYDMLADVMLRHRLEDCIDMPKHVVSLTRVALSPQHKILYNQLRLQAKLVTESGDVSAFNAGSLIQKLLQCLSGAVYDEFGNVVEVSTDRYNLILDLVEQREHCVVAFLWKHQRDRLVAEAGARKVSHAVIDGSVSSERRNDIVRQYQDGEIKVLFAHPQSAGHGLTLTRGTTTIWASPTYNAEHFEQFNRRIYRAGQKLRTETIIIVADGTKEEEVYTSLSDKTAKMALLLNLINDP